MSMRGSDEIIYRPRRSWICCTKYKDSSNFRNILQNLDITDVQKQIIRIRYLSILENFQRRSRNYSYLFFSGHFIVTVGSLFVPALLSIQNSDKSYTFTNYNFTVQVYWTTFVISLLVTIFNGVLTLFKVDKKYYFLNTTLERLRSEGWQYFSLTGRYDGRLLKSNIPTHSNQFIHFTHYVEKIKMKQVEEEYYKADEKIGQVPPNTNTTNQNNNVSELFPPSLDLPLRSMKDREPDAVRQAVDALIKSHTTILERDKNKNNNLESIQDTILEKEQNIIVIPEDVSITSVDDDN